MKIAALSRALPEVATIEPETWRERLELECLFERGCYRMAITLNDNSTPTKKSRFSRPTARVLRHWTQNPAERDSEL